MAIPSSVEARPQGAQSKDLTTISVAKLLQNDDQARSDLFEACKHMGFFYLDCRDDPSGLILNHVRALTTTSLEFFNEPQDSKARWSIKTGFVEGEDFEFGYKASGDRPGCIEGKKDGWEGIQLQEYPLKIFPKGRPIAAPEVFQNARGLVESAQVSLGKMSRLILDSLSQSLNMYGSKSLVELHREDRPSDTAMEVLKYLPYMPQSDKVGHLAHTDLGSLSIVFADVGGLQVFHPIERKWVYIDPKPDHAVCNIGDSVEFLTKGVLKSSLHRVVPHPLQKERIKVSVIYFLRPATDAVFVDRDGKEWKSADWAQMKGHFLKEGQRAKGSRTALTGRDGHDEFWHDEQMVDAK